MLLELFLRLEAYAVDALQHLVVRIAFPVCAGMLEQLEVAALLHRVHMRAAAEIHEFSLTIDGDAAILQVADQISLYSSSLNISSASALEDLLTDDALSILGDLFHLFGDLFQIGII